MPHLLITGASGFAGRYLVEYCARQGVRVTALAHTEIPVSDTHSNVQWIRCDLEDRRGVFDLLQKTRPDRIVHLAGISHIPVSWQEPEKTFRVNFLGAYHLFQGVVDCGLSPRVLVVSSSDVYDPAGGEGKPISEEGPIRPITPYAVTKLGIELLAHTFVREQNMDAVIVRAFSHTGPGQKPNFVCSSFARQIARIEAGEEKASLSVGDLDVVRDFTDVRDIARAYWLALEKGERGEVYNICSGRMRSIDAVLRLLLGLSDRGIEVRRDPEKIRKTDVPVQIGNPAKFRETTGWSPAIPLDTTLRDLLDYWREDLKKSTGPLQ